MDLSKIAELEKSLNELSDKQGYKAFQFLFWRAYENDDLDLYELLKRSIEYGGEKREN